MKNKKFHTLQGKLGLLVSMIALTSLLFFFGNFYLAGIVSEEYTLLIEQNQLMPQYMKALSEYRSALQKYSNMTKDLNCMKEYLESKEKLVRIATELFEAFPDPYIENLSYLSENLSRQGMLIITETKKGETEAAKSAYTEFSSEYSLLNKYTVYVQQSIDKLSVQEISRIGSQQAERQRNMLLVFLQCYYRTGCFIFSSHSQHRAADFTSHGNGKSGNAECMGSPGGASSAKGRNRCIDQFFLPYGTDDSGAD